MSKRDDERVIFAAFLLLEPLFSGEKITTLTQPQNESEFPDVTCISESGLKIGVELGEWLNEAEIRHAKGMERIQTSILGAVDQ
jgi:hypothetical protein